MSTDTTPTSAGDGELVAQLAKKYNWSGDRDYQLAVIAFKQMLPTFTAKAVAAAEIDLREAELHQIPHELLHIPEVFNYKQERLEELHRQKELKSE